VSEYFETLNEKCFILVPKSYIANKAFEFCKIAHNYSVPLHTDHVFVLLSAINHDQHYMHPKQSVVLIISHVGDCITLVGLYLNGFSLR